MLKLIITLFALSAMAAEPGFRPLFDGKTLNGWEGDPKLWSVKDGVILGSTDGIQIPANTFLISKEQFQDFELRFEIKLRNHNSGMQFRSDAIPGTEWGVKGLQADAAQGNWWGSIYDERGTRGVIVNGWKGKAETVVKATDWNDYTIECRGGDIKIMVNGMVTAELHGETPRAGVLAMQLHRGPGMQVEFRNVRIKELK